LAPGGGIGAVNSTVTNHPRRVGVVVGLVTVLVALAGMFAPAVSAAAGVGPKTHVRAIDHPTPVGVGMAAGRRMGAVVAAMVRRPVCAAGDGR